MIDISRSNKSVSTEKRKGWSWKIPRPELSENVSFGVGTLSLLLSTAVVS